MAKRKSNYSAKIADLVRAMKQEMWSIIEKRATTDDRYEAPKRYLERNFDNEGREICEVDYNGRQYGVTGIRLEKNYSGYISVSIVAEDGYYYSGLDAESICVLLSALRRQRQRKAEWIRQQQRLAEMNRIFSNKH